MSKNLGKKKWVEKHLIRSKSEKKIQRGYRLITKHCFTIFVSHKCDIKCPLHLDKSSGTY